MNGYEVQSYFKGKRPYVGTGPSPRFEAGLGEQTLEIVAEVLEHYGVKSDSEIKTAVYLTEPMRRIIRAEKRGERTDRVAVLSPRGAWPAT